VFPTVSNPSPDPSPKRGGETEAAGGSAPPLRFGEGDGGRGFVTLS